MSNGPCVSLLPVQQNWSHKSPSLGPLGCEEHDSYWPKWQPLVFPRQPLKHQLQKDVTKCKSKNLLNVILCATLSLSLSFPISVSVISSLNVKDCIKNQNKLFLFWFIFKNTGTHTGTWFCILKQNFNYNWKACNFWTMISQLSFYNLKISLMSITKTN